MNKNIVHEYYLLSLKDLEDGASIRELEEALELYEEAEMYEECAGILKAINEVRFYKLIKQIDDNTGDKEIS